MITPVKLLGISSLLVSVVAFIIMLTVIGINSQQIAQTYLNNVNILLNNISFINSQIPSILACQAMIPILNQEYLSCVYDGSIECSNKSVQEVLLQTQLNNLNNTKEMVQGLCTNRTNLILEEIANLTIVQNVTIVQSGNLIVSVTGASSFNAGFEHQRLVLGGELKVDILILKPWVNTISTAATDPLITYSGFPIVNNGKVPLYETYFSGSINVTGRMGLVFYGIGNGGGTVKLESDIVLKNF